MRPYHRPSTTVITCLSACLSAFLSASLAVGTAHAAKNLGFDIECDTLKLEAASGVPNKPQHAYRFAGSCRGRTTAATATMLSASDKAPGEPPKQAAVPPPPKRLPPGLKSTSEIKSAPHLTVRSPQAKEVFSGPTVPVAVVAPDTLIHNYGAGMALFDWEMAPSGGAWSRVDMLRQVKWTERDGHIFVAAIDVPVSRFTRSVRWRMRARADHQAVAPTAWVEFSVVPVAQ